MLLRGHQINGKECVCLKGDKDRGTQLLPNASPSLISKQIQFLDLEPRLTFMEPFSFNLFICSTFPRRLPETTIPGSLY